MSRVLADGVVKELCEIWGFDSKEIASIDIVLRPREIASIIIKRYLGSDELAKMVDVFRRYEISAVKEKVA